MTNKRTRHSRNKQRRNTGILHFVQDDGVGGNGGKLTYPGEFLLSLVFRMRVSIASVAARSSGSVTSRTISVWPMAVGRTKERMPLRFFLSREVRATSFLAVALNFGSGP